MSARLDYEAGGEAAYTGLEGDAYDSRAMQPFSPDPSMPWWQGIATYGITRAIDNRFGPPNVGGNTSPGSFAGQNGRTYANAPTGQGGTAQLAGMSIPPLLLIGGAVLVAYLALKG